MLTADSNNDYISDRDPDLIANENWVTDKRSSFSLSQCLRPSFDIRCTAGIYKS